MTSAGSSRTSKQSPRSEPPPELAGPERQVARELYAKECAVCHGPAGKGDGPGARMLSPAPTNFHEVQPTTEYASTVLTSGVRGTAMPRWEPKLTPAQREAAGPLRPVVLRQSRGVDLRWLSTSSSSPSRS